MTGRRHIGGPRDRNARLALLHGWWDRAVVHGARVGVVGAGALGNEILKNLALLDFRHVLLVDKDIVEPTNLSRAVLYRAAHEGEPKVLAAAQALKDLNPDLCVEAIHGDVVHEIGLGRLRELDVIIAGLDSRYVRWWLNRTCHALGIPWVEGATQGSYGHAVVFLPGDAPCYECSFSDSDRAALKRVASCGQLQIDAATQGRIATSPTVASLVGATQVHLAMELLHRRPVESGRSLLFNLEIPEAFPSGRRRALDCPAHFKWEPMLVSEFGTDVTIADLLGLVATEIGAPATLELRWDLVWEFNCYSCGERTPVRRPRGLITASDAFCPRCESERSAKIIYRLTTEAHGELSLADVGIPPNDIVQVRGPKGSMWVELTGNRPTMPTATGNQARS